jgi:hypothetical protein
VEDKVQELQQQLLARLVGGGGFDAAEGEGDDEVGDEEAVAALNDRVAKLLRMRSQIMQVFFFITRFYYSAIFFCPSALTRQFFFSSSSACARK